MYLDGYIPQRLVKFFRDGLVEQEHLGFVMTCDLKFGEDFGYPFYLRSCSKPLIATLIVDEELDFTEDEIAICCASHAGEPCHVEIAQRLARKVGVTPDMIKCGLHKPLSKTAQADLIRKGETETVFHNNCVGKHILMLALCKKNGWDTENYYELEHPVQQLIKEKIYDLCQLDDEYPITKDGCGVPICSMPLKHMLNGYLNVFTSQKYEIIKRAFRDYPYIIGGEDRLDTKIMQNSNDLVAKVGAGGLSIVVDTKMADCLIIKVLDGDAKAREIATLSMLTKMDWAVIPYEKYVKTLHGDILGEMKFIAV